MRSQRIGHDLAAEQKQGAMKKYQMKWHASEWLGAGGEEDDPGWDGWMASPTRWTWVWVNSGSWWWTGRPGVLWFTESQRVAHDWATELNWTALLIQNVILQMYQIFTTYTCLDWLYKIYSPKVCFADGLWTSQLFVFFVFLWWWESRSHDIMLLW